jgi:hypothetical protein
MVIDGPQGSPSAIFSQLCVPVCTRGVQASRLADCPLWVRRQWMCLSRLANALPTPFKPKKRHLSAKKMISESD